MRQLQLLVPGSGNDDGAAPSGDLLRFDRVISLTRLGRGGGGLTRAQDYHGLMGQLSNLQGGRIKGISYLHCIFKATSEGTGQD